MATPTSPPPDTPVEEEDLMENLETDYKINPDLDKFDDEDIDDADISPMQMAERRAVDRALDNRDNAQTRNRRTFIPHQLMDDDDDDDLAGDNNVFKQQQQRRINDLMTDDQVLSNNNNENLVNLEDFDGPLREWLDEDRVRKEIKNRFKEFLTSFTDQSGDAIYPEKLKEMCQENKCSLNVSYMHLSEWAAVLAIWLVEQPQIMLELFDSVAMDVARISFPDYDKIHSAIHTRIISLPLTDELRDLRQIHLNLFVQVNGVVTRRTSIYPQLKLVRFDCLKCGFTTSPIAQNIDKSTSNKNMISPSSCPDCLSSGPFKLNESKTIYRNYQKIVLQETPGSVPAGRIPRSRDIILTDDLCDSIRPGEEICVIGIYKNIFNVSTNILSGFPVFNTIIEANNILKENDYYNNRVEITDDEKSYFINTLAKNPQLEQQILKSVAPSIYGHTYIKKSLLYALLAGQEKVHNNKHRVRGDINILILGDPGTAKSQFLKYVEKVAFRAVYATGKGASAVGLTASVHRDPITKEWTLEGGALVLADRGICLIDEFDKMNEQDRVSIHEAMEQQSISISKAGIIASLQARCSVIAAANPIRGRYDGSLTFLENVDLTDPILSRFDILAVVRDRVDVIKDELLANFVVGNHMKCHPSNDEEPEEEEEEEEEKKKQASQSQTLADNVLTQEMLKKYLFYCKQTCHPKLDNIDRDKIADFYSELRQKSMQSGGIPIAVRHIESILRISEARAKLHLREYVRSDDVDNAISILLESFISTQKQSIQISLNKHFKSYLNYNKQKNYINLLLHVLHNEITEETKWRQIHSTHQTGGGGGSKKDSEDLDEMNDIEVDIKTFKEKIQSLNINNANLMNFYKSQSFKDAGFLYDKKKKVIRKVLS